MSKSASDTLAKVAGEFEGEVLADLQEGRGQALAAVDSARKGAAEEVAKILLGGAKQAESLKRQLVGAAELDARNAQLRAVEAAVSEAFASAIQGLPKVAEAKYEKALTQLISEGVEVIGTKAVVSCNARDRKLVAGAVKKLSEGHVKLTLAAEPVESIGGVVLSTEDGTVRFDNTFEARLERMRPALRKDVAALLGQA